MRARYVAGPAPRKRAGTTIDTQGVTLIQPPAADGVALRDWLAPAGIAARLPLPHFNVLKGGAHAQTHLAFRSIAHRPGGLDAAVGTLLARAHQLAESRLEGIEEAAKELVELAQDRRVIERAIRTARDRVHSHPTRTNKQIASLVRRAIELGMSKWQWDETAPVP